MFFEIMEKNESYLDEIDVIKRTQQTCINEIDEIYRDVNNHKNKIEILTISDAKIRMNKLDCTFDLFEQAQLRLINILKILNHERLDTEEKLDREIDNMHSSASAALIDIIESDASIQFFYGSPNTSNYRFQSNYNCNSFSYNSSHHQDFQFSNFDDSRLNSPIYFQSQPNNSKFNLHAFKTTQPKCYICSDSHYIHKCQDFLNLNVKDRRSKIVEDGRCLICFRLHNFKDCFSTTLCSSCGNQHHSLLHVFEPCETKTTKVNSINDKRDLGILSNNFVRPQVPKFKPQDGPRLNLNKNWQIFGYIFCNEAHRSFQYKQLLQKELNLPFVKTNLEVQSFASSASDVKGEPKITYVPHFREQQRSTNVLVVDHIILPLPSKLIDLGITVKFDVRFADLYFFEKQLANLLLRIQEFCKIIEPNTILKDGNLFAIKSDFGFLIRGNISSDKLSEAKVIISNFNVTRPKREVDTLLMDEKGSTMSHLAIQCAFRFFKNKREMDTLLIDEKDSAISDLAIQCAYSYFKNKREMDTLYVDEKGSAFQCACSYFKNKRELDTLFIDEKDSGISDLAIQCSCSFFKNKKEVNALIDNKCLAMSHLAIQCTCYNFKNELSDDTMGKVKLKPNVKEFHFLPFKLPRLETQVLIPRFFFNVRIELKNHWVLMIWQFSAGI